MEAFVTRMPTDELTMHLEETLDRVAHGERIVLERAGKPPVALVPVEDLDRLDEELPPPIPTLQPLTREFIDDAIREGRS